MDIDEARQCLLPKKSRERYEFTYEIFKKWCLKKNVVCVSENVMLAYMMERSEHLKSSASLWCEYSMLKKTLNYKDNVDISKFLKLLSFLKRKHQGYQPKKSQMLTREQITKFIDEAADKKYLLIKTVMIVGIAGACRTDEFCRMEMADVVDHGKYVIITIPQSGNDVVRKFTIVENPESNIDYLRIFKKYYEIRKKVANSSRFFLRYQSGKCCNQPVGKHTFSKMPSIIAGFLNLPDANLFTRQCFRRSSGTLLVDSGMDILSLKRHRGSKSSTVAENYGAESIQNKLDVADQISYKKSCISSTSPTSQIEADPVALTKVEMSTSLQTGFAQKLSETIETTTAQFEKKSHELLEYEVENEVAENSKDYIIENASNETICSEEDVKPEILQDISSQTPTKLTTNTLPEIEITLKDVLKFLRRKFPDQYTELIKDQLDSLKASPNTSTSSRSQDHSEASSSQDVTDTYEEHYLSHPKRRMIDKSQRNLSTNVSGSSSTMVDPLKTSENGEINYEVPKIHPDLAFFMSLVPSVQMLDEDQRLLFRMKVLKALRSVKQGNTQIVESSGIETHRIYDISELKEESLSESDISFDE